MYQTYLTTKQELDKTCLQVAAVVQRTNKTEELITLLTEGTKLSGIEIQTQDSNLFLQSLRDIYRDRLDAGVIETNKD